MLARALEAKDAYTRGHSIRVSQYAVGTAQRLGFDGPSLDGIRLGGELHDIGKIGTREAVLHKPGTLTDDEFRQITEHPVLGERMLLPLARESPDVLRIVRSHHERVDGRGFPDGLRGEMIPIEARIVAVADSFDAMTTERPYRDAREPDDAVDELRRVAGTQLDPAAVEAFVDAFPIRQTCRSRPSPPPGPTRPWEARFGPSRTAGPPTRASCSGRPRPASGQCAWNASSSSSVRSSRSAIAVSAPIAARSSSSSLICMATLSRFWVFWIRKTIRKVTMVVPVLMTSCQVSLKPKTGPVTAQTTIARRARPKVAGWPAARAVALGEPRKGLGDFHAPSRFSPLSAVA